MTKRVITGIAAFLLLALPMAAKGADPGPLPAQPALVRLSYDPVKLPGDERLDLAGASLLLEGRPWFHYGIGVYGAVGGRRGGFFTGGVEGALRHRIAGPLLVEGGLFAGGGGGGNAPQGGGLMLRPHAGLLLETGYGNLGVGAASVWFPNGAIRSTNVSVSWEHPLEIFAKGGWSSQREPAGRESSSRRRIFAEGKVYLPRGGGAANLGRPLGKAIGLTGGGVSYFLTDDFYMGIAAAGAVTGGADGYAEVTARPGYRWLIPGGVEVALEGGIGAAGGGSVPTGGGLFTDAAAVLRVPLGCGLSAAARGGGFWAPQSGYRGTAMGLQVAYDGKGDGSLARWRLRVGPQRYAAGRIRSAAAADDRRVDLIGVKIDRMAGENFYLTGQALSAFAGGAGGYSVGLLGGGWTAPLWRESPLFAQLELAAGAGGGGGVSTRGGFLLQPSAGIGWMFSDAVGALASAGLARGPAGDLKAVVADVNLVWRFTTRD